MYIRDKGDGLSREGSGRVAIFKLTNLMLCYTLECNYNMGQTTNKLSSRSNNFDLSLYKPADEYNKLVLLKLQNGEEQYQFSEVYGIQHYSSLGEVWAIFHSLQRGNFTLGNPWSVSRLLRTSSCLENPKHSVSKPFSKQISYLLLISRL